MKKWKRLMGCLGLVAFACGTSASESPVFEGAKLLTTEPFEPSHAMQKYGSEGWVYYKYVVDTDGTVKNVELLDSSGAKHFETAIVRYLEELKYEPAILDGKPVEQTIGPRPFTMMFDMDRAVKRGFRSLVLKARKALEAGDTEEVIAIRDKLQQQAVGNLYAEVYIQFLSAMIAREQGEIGLERLYLDRCLDFAREDLKHRYLDSEQIIGILVRFYELEVGNFQIADSQESLEWLEEIDADHPAVKEVRAHADFVASKVNDAMELRMKAELLEKGYGDRRGWRAALLRDRVYVTNVQGQVDKGYLRCEQGELEYFIEIDKVYTVPDGWSDCDFMVFGRKNTRFELVEPPV